MANTIEIKVPDIGDFEKIPVIEILASIGDELAVDDPLITLESDKATMEVPTNDAGKLIELKVAVGDQVGKGDVIALFEVSDSTSAASHTEDVALPADNTTSEVKVAESPAQTVSKSENSEEPEVPKTSEVTHASPSVRKLARKLNISLNKVNATGRKNRITEDDLHQYIQSSMNSGGGHGLNIAAPRSIDFSKFGDIEEQPLSRIQKISGPHLHRNWVTIPHVTQNDKADITDLEAFRKAHDELAKAEGTRLTLIVFLIKACVAALKTYPKFNASLNANEDALIMKKYFHIGIAVDTPDGLVVPVIRNCDQKNLLELSHELTDLSGRAREGKLKPAEMQGACFSISSLGGIGGTSFTPIVNSPEVAILGVSRSSMEPVWNKATNTFEPRLMLPLSVSYDHRVIDGAAAARFTRFLATRLDDFRRVTL